MSDFEKKGLFDIYQSRQLSFALAVFSVIQSGERLSLKDCRTIYNAMLLPYDGFNDTMKIFKQYLNLDYSDDPGQPFSLGIAQAFIRKCKIYLPLSEIECDYLNFILDKPEADLFLTSKTKASVSASINGPRSYLSSVNHELPPTPNYSIAASDFKNLLRAIHEHKMITYKYSDANSGKSVLAESYPWKLEFDAFNHKWGLIVYDKEKDRILSLNPEHMQDIILGKSQDLSKQVEFALEREKSPDPVRLKITEERSGIDRCFMEFENRDVIETSKNGSECFLSFDWYKFDEDEILRRLLYLGSSVRLLGPKCLKDKLLALVNRAIDLQTGN